MTRLALCDVSGPLTDLLQKLSGEDGEQWMRALNKMLRKENPWEALSIWRTLKLGTGPKSADGFRKAINGCGMKIGDWAYDILGKPEFTTAVEEKEVDLVKVTLAELGFKDGVRRDQIYARAKELGLELCPSEVGPQLRLQYKDQPNNEWLFIAMEPIRDSDGSLGVFDLAHADDGLWLRSRGGNPADVWHAGRRWVFVRPRK